MVCLFAFCFASFGTQRKVDLGSKGVVPEPNYLELLCVLFACWASLVFEFVGWLLASLANYNRGWDVTIGALKTAFCPVGN